MNLDKFWKLIEQSKRKSEGDFDEQVEIIKEKLSKLPVKEIVFFDRIFYELYAKIHSSNIWAAFEIINQGYSSDDTYDYFRAWLIGQGREIYEIAVSNPDNLAQIDSIATATDYSGELLMYVASEAYEEKTGEENFDELLIEGEETITYQNIELDWIDENKQTIASKLKEKLPKLYQRYWKE